ncbi:MAG: transcriptional regulator, partial [Betaproteobacteria bacterium]
MYRTGWVRCTLPLESIEFGVRELMRLRSEVIVTGPPALRTQLVMTAGRMARLHATPPSRR